MIIHCIQIKKKGKEIKKETTNMMMRSFSVVGANGIKG